MARMIRVRGAFEGWVRVPAGAPIDVLARRFRFAARCSVSTLSLWSAEVPIVVEAGDHGLDGDAQQRLSRNDRTWTLSVGLAGSPGDARHAASALGALPENMRHLAPQLSRASTGGHGDDLDDHLRGQPLTWHLTRSRGGRKPGRMTSELVSQLNPWLGNLPASESSDTIVDVLGDSGSVPEYFGARLRRARSVLADIPHTVAHGDLSRHSLTISGGEISAVTGWSHCLPSAPVGFDAFSAMADSLGMREANLREVTKSGFWHHPSVVAQLRGIHSGYRSEPQRDALALVWAVVRWRLTDPAARHAGIPQVAGA